MKGKLMHCARFIVLLLIFTVATAVQAQDTLQYGPSVVTITGVAVSDTFPGPPNYESIQAGDKPEDYWVLRLSSPIFVLGAPNDDLNVSENDISALQLVFMNSDDYNTYRKLLNGKVKVTGTLFHAMSGHHHTKVLLAVKNMVAG